MSRIKVVLPTTFQFSTNYTVRVGDLNYGKHLGNDRLLGLAHQARIDFIQHLGGKSELDFFGTSLIMADVAINYLNEAFLGELLQFNLSLANPTKAGFDIYYEVKNGDKKIAAIKTGMVCFDYQARKIAPLSDKLLEIIPETEACVRSK